MVTFSVNELFQNNNGQVQFGRQVDDADGPVVVNESPKEIIIPVAPIPVPQPQVVAIPVPAPVIIEPQPIEEPKQEDLSEHQSEQPTPILSAPIIIEGSHNREVTPTPKKAKAGSGFASAFPSKKKSEQEVTPEFIKEFIESISSINYGDYLRGLMKIAGVSQKELAAYCKINFMYISDFVTLKKKLKKDAINSIIKYMNESQRLRDHPELFKTVCETIVDKFKEGVREETTKA